MRAERYTVATMSWFKRQHSGIEANGEKSVRTEGLWIKCPGCAETVWKADVDANLQVCPRCGHHYRISARDRIDSLLDPGYELLDTNLRSTDPLEFTDLKPYKGRLAAAQKASGLNDAVLSARGSLGPHPAVICALEFSFIGGSMGAVVGETIARAVDRAHDERRALLIVSASGGARMQEGIVSLMQLAKISTALARLDDAGLPYVSILTDPTTGGVTASFAMLGDLNIAEPGALIGFAGQRVIEQTIPQKLPEGFQRAEFLMAHGMLDAVVPRRELKSFCIRALDFMQPAAK